MEENLIKVYVQVDSNNVITNINSNIFISDTTGWIQIDEGIGDKYSHAQGNYLDKPLMDSNGKNNYKLVDNKSVELTDEEKASLFPIVTIAEPTIADLQAQIFNLTSQLVNGGVL